MDAEELALRIAEVKARRNPVFDSAAEAERELAAAAVGQAEPDVVEALELAIADNDAFAERKEQRRGA